MSTKIGTTKTGFVVVALDLAESSPMVNHKGGEIAVDDDAMIMYAHGVFVAMYGTDSVMRACESY